VDGKVVAYLAERSDEPPAIWIVDTKLEHPRRLAPLDPLLEGGAYGKSRLLRWKAVDGSERAGALLLPFGAEDGHLYPLIVDVYGGEPLSRQLNVFGCGSEQGISLQVLATRGYAVLRPDTPLRLGRPVQDLVDAVIPGLDAAVATGVIDRANIGVMGSSYGGYSTIALITRSERFRAAVAQATQADLFSAVYGNSGFRGSNPGWAEGSGQGRMGGTPWEFRQRYIDNSPAWFLDRVHTPLLLLHGTADPVVPDWESTLIFNSLQRLGREVEYVRYPGEGHSFTKEADRIDALARIVAWFNEHLSRKPAAGSAASN
jgi:dipeptidyl aminopeptidase/acylaminoacyl peptidase